MTTATRKHLNAAVSNTPALDAGPSTICPGDETTVDPPLDSCQLTLEHLWLADGIARRFHGRGEDDQDLQQVARCALLEAARRYDPRQGAFVPYAAPSINGVL